MIAALGILGILAFTLLWLEWGPRLTWGEGWLFPHEKPQEDCKMQCATCRGSMAQAMLDAEKQVGHTFEDEPWEQYMTGAEWVEWIHLGDDE